MFLEKNQFYKVEYIQNKKYKKDNFLSHFRVVTYNGNIKL